MSEATLNDVRITTARLQIPSYGVWWLDCETDDELELTGAADTKLVDLVPVGTVVSGGEFNGRSRFRIAGGAAAWGTDIEPKGYSNDAGVKASTVISDAATSAGETLDTASLPTTRTGPHFARLQSPASTVLQQLAPRNWYVGLDGATTVGQRPTVELDTERFTVIEHDKAAAKLTLETDTLEGLLPGAVLDGLTAVDVQIDLTPKKLKVTLWGRSESVASRRVEALRKLIDQLQPNLKFAGTFEYRIVTQSGERLNLQPVRSVLGLPDLRRVPVRNAAGIKATHVPGSLCLVTFIERDPGRPAVIAFDAPDSPGWMPTMLDLGDDTPLGIARIGDAVAGGVITTGSLKVRAGL